MWSLSLVMGECSLSGRGQGQVSNFYIVDLENFATASRRYTGDIHKSSVVGLFMTHLRQWKRLGRVMVECTLSITHCLRLNLQLHTIDLVRTCRISSFCIVAWQLARFQLTRRIARSLGDSWASCYRPDAIPATQPTVSVKARLLKQYAAFLCLWYFHWLKVKVTFSALTQLVGQHPASKNWVLRCWHGYLCGVRCSLFAYGPADATALHHHLLPYLYPDWFSFSGTGLPMLSWKAGH